MFFKSLSGHQLKIVSLVVLAVLLLIGLSLLTTVGQMKPSLTITNSNEQGLVLTLVEGTQAAPITKKIERIIIDDTVYKPNQNWFVTKFNTNLDSMTELYRGERILHRAIYAPTYIITEDKEKYAVTFTPLSWQDYSAVFYSTRIFSAIVLFFSIFIYSIAPKQRGSIIALAGSFSLAIAFLIADKWLSRLWAMDTELLYACIKIAQLFGVFYSASIFYLIWYLPKPLSNQKVLNHTPAFVLAILLMLYLVTLFTASSHAQNRLEFAYVLTHLLVYLIIGIKTIIHYKNRQKDILGWITIRWVSLFALISIIIPAGFYFLVMLGRLDTTPVYVNDSIAFLKIGLSALVASSILYQAESFWWHLWVLLIGFGTFLVSFFLLHIFNGFMDFQIYIAFVIAIGAAYSTARYLKKRYVIHISAAIEEVLPKMLTINPEFDMARSMTSVKNAPSANLSPWVKALIHIFRPTIVRYDSDIARTALDTTIALPSANIDTVHTDIASQRPVVFMASEGAALYIKDFSDASYVEMIGANNGLRLFTTRDIELIISFWQILKQHENTQRAFIEGEASERRRVAADLHDDIGGKLLYLASRDGALGEYAHETLQDLRILARGLSSQAKPLEDVLADINFALAEKCDLHAVMYDSQFSIDDIAEDDVSARGATALTSILNELSRNALKHTEVSGIKLTMRHEHPYLLIHFYNDGAIVDISQWQYGIGISSIKRRVASWDGLVQWTAIEMGGVECVIKVPFDALTH